MAAADNRVVRFPVGAEVRRFDLEGVDPHPVLDRLRATEPVSWLPELDCWLVTDRATAVAVLRDAERFTVDDPRFSTAKVVGPSMLSLDGTEHRRHRSPFVGPFRARSAARELGPAAVAEADRLVDRLAARGRAELRTELAGPLAVATITRALGLIDTDEEQILAWYRAIVSGVLDVDAGRPLSPATETAVASLADRVTATIEDSPGQSGSMLARIAETAPLSVDELFSNVAVLMFGAIETAEGMTANALFHLLRHPDRLAEVDGDRSLIGAAIEESLRLEPAAAVVDRYATEVTAVSDRAEIGGGDLVRVSLSGANRDPAVFDRPHRFALHGRDPALHLSFVPGPHACIGLHLARIETAAAIAAVLDRLPDVALDEAATTEPTGLIFRKPDRLTATWSTDQVDRSAPAAPVTAVRTPRCSASQDPTKEPTRPTRGGRLGGT